LGLTGVVAVSTLLHWLAGRRLGGLWIMPDEAVYAARAIALWRHGSLPPLRGPGAGYGVLYPLVAGFPFSFGSIARGYGSLKLLQALVVSLAAVPVFVSGRRLMLPRYALLAAVLTVASPLLLYSGLVMTEVLFYPLAALALLAVVRAVADKTFRGQAIAFALIFAAVLTRTQAVVFVGVFAGAILLDAAFARERSHLRSFWPTWVILGTAVAALVAAPSVVGSYAVALRGSYPLGPALRLSFEHLSYLALGTGLAPFAALVLLSAAALRGRERDPEARALIAVCVSATGLVVLQVGFFAARYAPHLLGRDLAPLPPLLFLVFALWLARGAPRTLVTATLAAFAVLCVVLLAPWNALVVPAAFADTLDLLLVNRVHVHEAVNVVMVFSILMLLVFVAVPRRSVLVLPAIVLAVLVAGSAIASNQLAHVVNDAQGVLGPDRGWIDRTARGNVAYLYDGEAFWNVVWQERFWNPRIDHVYSIRPTDVAGPMPQTPITVGPAGRLPLHERYVVASDRHTFVGTAVAHLAQQGLDVSGLTLWRLNGRPRLSTIEAGLQPNGDMDGPATVDVYDCKRGRLELTLLPKQTNVLRILLDGRLVLRQAIGGLGVWHGTIPVPTTRQARRCTFTIVGQQLLGSTRIDFARGN
jgi:Dolichyl-phosphate-mannose-protein mannosyltransferase